MKHTRMTSLTSFLKNMVFTKLIFKRMLIAKFTQAHAAFGRGILLLL